MRRSVIKKRWMLTGMMMASICSGQVYFEAGPWFRGDMDVSVDGGSRAAESGTQATRSGTQGATARIAAFAPPDDGTAQVLREFDDGYVGPSGWIWARDAGLSQYFGYQNDSQYDASADTLTFTASRSASSTERRTRTEVRSAAPGWSGHSSLDGSGGLVTVGYGITTKRLFNVSLQIQAGWLDGLDASFRGRQAWRQDVTWTTTESSSERSQSWNYIYDTLGHPSFPPAPYAETDPSGAGGNFISDRPMEITEAGGLLVETDRVVGQKRRTAFSRVDLETEGRLLVLTFGPRLRFRLLENLSVLVQGGVTANFLDVEWTRAEVFAWEDGQEINSWVDRDDEQKWLWGGTISAGVQWALTPQWYVVASGGHDWVESTHVTVGPDRLRYNLDGWRAEVAAGWLF